MEEYTKVEERKPGAGMRVLMFNKRKKCLGIGELAYRSGTWVWMHHELRLQRTIKEGKNGVQFTERYIDIEQVMQDVPVFWVPISTSNLLGEFRLQEEVLGRT